MNDAWFAQVPDSTARDTTNGAEVAGGTAIDRVKTPLRFLKYGSRIKPRKTNEMGHTGEQPRSSLDPPTGTVQRVSKGAGGSSADISSDGSACNRSRTSPPEIVPASSTLDLTVIEEPEIPKTCNVVVDVKDALFSNPPTPRVVTDIHYCANDHGNHPPGATNESSLSRAPSKNQIEVTTSISSSTEPISSYVSRSQSAATSASTDTTYATGKIGQCRKAAIRADLSPMEVAENRTRTVASRVKNSRPRKAKDVYEARRTIDEIVRKPVQSPQTSQPVSQPSTTSVPSTAPPTYPTPFQGHTTAHDMRGALQSNDFQSASMSLDGCKELHPRAQLAMSPVILVAEQAPVLESRRGTRPSQLALEDRRRGWSSAVAARDTQCPSGIDPVVPEGNTGCFAAPMERLGAPSSRSHCDVLKPLLDDSTRDESYDQPSMDDTLRLSGHGTIYECPRRENSRRWFTCAGAESTCEGSIRRTEPGESACLEARVEALERENELLKAALMAVLKTTSQPATYCVCSRGQYAAARHQRQENEVE
ncbi:hypothetical protein BDY21DRAFT_363090 [Lineolata rhizophorae]|uniref:Uncharacterized protein n=1 Tax=Lineolata rhizophorae TaxID=578093 RepID=A0A6A6P2Z0_9PEZI|nr:hypothetical protein BDY21DRAFT_363090 [Lineolata rhizophorae]